MKIGQRLDSILEMFSSQWFYESKALVQTSATTLQELSPLG